MLEDCNMDESANRGTGRSWDGFVRECGREKQDISSSAHHFSGQTSFREKQMAEPSQIWRTKPAHSTTFLFSSSSLNEAN